MINILVIPCIVILKSPFNAFSLNIYCAFHSYQNIFVYFTVMTGMMDEVYGEVSHLLTYVAAGNVNPVDNGARKFLEEECACAKPSSKAHGDGGDVDAAVNACISATVGDFMSGEFLKMLPSSDCISPDNVKRAENKKPQSKKLSKIADSICDDLLADIMSKLKR